LGRCHYLPVRLGYALTVHRSQGLTLNNVQARLSNLRWLSGGLYTILSRVRHYSGLRLIGTRSAFCDSCYIEPSILKFYNQLGTKS
jgi:ATP-dependent exoDNAse (exonuclease V) alpha subunit